MPLPMSSFLTFQSRHFMLHFREGPIELHLEMLHFRGNLCMELCLDMPHSRESFIVTMFINMPHASFIPGRELYVHCILCSFFIPEKDTCAHTLGKALYSSACAYSIARSSLGQCRIYITFLCGGAMSLPEWPPCSVHSKGVWGHAPQEILIISSVLRHILVQSEIKSSTHSFLSEEAHHQNHHCLLSYWNTGNHLIS